VAQTAADITLEISDNGKGCNMTIKQNGVGIIKMQSRAELAGGRATAVSSTGKGFGLTVVVAIPRVFAAGQLL
jgi:signal transduction histidine kinase